VIGFACAEAYVRRFAPRRPVAAERVPLPVQPCADARIRIENRPGARYVLNFDERSSGGRREVVATINDQGFRGPVVDRPKPPGTLRILALGDSQTFGIGVGEGASWPAVLAQELARGGERRRVEVMNCAVAGYDAEQELASLETRWLEYEPDLVLLGYFVNDPGLPGIQGERPSGFYHELLSFVSPGRGGLLESLRQRSALVDFVLDATFRRARVHEWARGGEALHEDDFEGWVRTRAAIVRERDLARARGARFAVLLLPFLVRWNDGLLSTEPYRTVAAFCAQEEIPCLDLEPAFAGRDPATLLVDATDAHSGAEAHRIEGEAVARWIAERKMLLPAGN
jgi:lysophospholipase L1-like esterase